MVHSREVGNLVVKCPWNKLKFDKDIFQTICEGMISSWKSITTILNLNYLVKKKII